MPWFWKYFDGKIKPLNDIKTDPYYFELILKSLDLQDEIIELYENRLFSQVVRKIFTLIEDVNELINDQQPWNLAKNIEQNKEQLHNVLTTSAYIFRNATIYLTPILPNLSLNVAKLFNENIFHNFKQIHEDIKSVTTYKHLLQRLEAEQVDRLLDTNKKQDLLKQDDKKD